MGGVMKVVAINGSAQKDGNTAILLKTAIGELEKEGIETELIQLSGKTIQGCRACVKCYSNRDRKCSVDKDIVNDLIARIFEADGVLLGSPTYFGDMSANMKALIERCGLVAKANDDMLKRKVGAAVVAVRRGGAINTFNSINNFFTISQMIVVGSSYWNDGLGLAPGDVNSDDEGLQTMRNLGKNMAWLLKKIHA